MKVKMICFDMDGTVADLYGVNGWLEMLRQYDPTPYIKASPMWDMAELANILMALQHMGIEIRIITWLSKESTREYDNLVRAAKREWLEAYGFPYDHFHGVAYGTTKADSVRRYLAEDESAILIDDNAKVREGWHLGDVIDPTVSNIIEILKGLLNQ
jgi:FMN phosphatase YigB (HAD superfamily)